VRQGGERGGGRVRQGGGREAGRREGGRESRERGIVGGRARARGEGNGEGEGKEQRKGGRTYCILLCPSFYKSFLKTDSSADCHIQKPTNL
jgi:hypothetical protein